MNLLNNSAKICGAPLCARRLVLITITFAFPQLTISGLVSGQKSPIHEVGRRFANMNPRRFNPRRSRTDTPVGTASGNNWSNPAISCLYLINEVRGQGQK